MAQQVERQAVFLAALLHDIGKFFQRADPAGTEKSKLLSPETRNLESAYCPQYNGRYSHKHVLWTAQFLDNHQSKLRQVLGEQYAVFFGAAVAHHRPDPNNLLQMLVQKADHYSSGADRTQGEALKDEEHEHRWDDFKRVRMTCLFEGLLQEKPDYQYRLPVTALALDDSFFPKKAEQFSAAPDYPALWRQFEEEFAGLDPTAPEAFGETLLELLHKYTVTVPSSTVNLPDVSLFDHLKSTAALALCLYEYVKQGPGKLWGKNDEEEPLLLVGADISGIQAYIYDIVGTDAAKNLKGRSFYLQLLTDTVLQRLLDALDLPRAQAIYASGGGFYLLAPNVPKVHQELASLREEISRQLFSHHQTGLYLVLDAVPVSEGQVYQKRISEAWKDLTEKLNRQKRQRFRPQLTQDYGFFFEESEVGGASLRDVITNEEFTDQDQIQGKKGIRYLKEERNKPVKAATYQQIQLGRSLRMADYTVMATGEPLRYWEQDSVEPLGLGYHHYFVSQNQLERQQERLRGSADRVRVQAINNASFLQTEFRGSGNRYGLMLYGGNRFPEDEEGYPKLFDELAQGLSLKRLGYLRMDVDNLGQVFVRGLPEQKRTFSRYSALSRNLDFFFKGYLNTIWKSKREFTENTFILYSGGDDLFIVGRWDCILDLAALIRQEFGRWVCQNPNLGLSGGVAIVGGKFPIAKAAQMAEEAEKQAKSHQYLEKEKDAFSLLGYALNWEHELPVVKELKQRLADLITQDTMPRGILSKINGLFLLMQEQKNKGRNESWRWLIAYDFARARQRLRSEAGKSFLEEIKTAVFAEEYRGQKLQSRYPFLELLHLAARWTELEIRK